MKVKIMWEPVRYTRFYVRLIESGTPKTFLKSWSFYVWEFLGGFLVFFTCFYKQVKCLLVVCLQWGFFEFRLSSFWWLFGDEWITEINFEIKCDSLFGDEWITEIMFEISCNCLLGDEWIIIRNKISRFSRYFISLQNSVPIQGLAPSKTCP